MRGPPVCALSVNMKASTRKPTPDTGALPLNLWNFELKSFCLMKCAVMGVLF